MGAAMDHRESSVRSRELGARLRAAMAAAGLPGTQVAARMGVSQSQVSRWLTGLHECREVDAAVFLAVCGVTDTATRDQVLSAGAARHLPGVFRVPGEQRWRVYGDHAATAGRLVEFAPAMVPWMLQDTDYTGALAIAAGVRLPELPAWVSHRARLADLVGDDGPARVEVFVHEWALRTPVGRPEVMAAQLRHLLTVSARPAVSLRVVPDGSTTPAGGPFTLLQFADSRAAVYRDEVHAGVFLDGIEDVQAHRDVLDRLSGLALNEQSSVELVRTIAADLRQSSVP